MSHPIAIDRDGCGWAILAINDRLKARLVYGTVAPAVMDLEALVDMHGPLILTSTRPTSAGVFEVLADTVGLVASDPETASIEQIRQVAAFAQSIVLPRCP